MKARDSRKVRIRATSLVAHRRIASKPRSVAKAFLRHWFGATTFEVKERGGYVRIQLRDYLISTLISTADLVIEGQATLPERGDRIRETVGSETFVYEVLALGAAPHYCYSDPYRQMLQIHAKHIANRARRIYLRSHTSCD